MKNFLAAAILILLAGCSTTQELARTVILTSVDFTPYADKGFLFTPEAYQGKYESRGIIKLDVIPQVKRLDFAFQAVDKKAWVPLGAPGEVWVAERLDSKAVIDEVYKAATAMGADAIVRFELITKEIHNGEILVPIYEATGYAIKRVN